MNYQITEKLENYIAQLRTNRELLWSVRLDRSYKIKGFKTQVSYSFLSEKLGVPKNVLSQELYRTQINKITTLLIQEQVILPEYGPSVLNMRRRLKAWWRDLTEQDKRSLQTYGNRVQLSEYVDYLRTGKGYELLKGEIESIHTELRELGVLDSNYVPVKYRDRLRNSEFLSDQTANKNRSRSLGELPLETIEDLVQPDIEIPFVQWEQLFMAASKGVSSNSGKSNYREAFNHTKAYLSQCGFSPISSITESIHDFFLISFRRDYLLRLLEKGEVAPSSASTIFSSLRMTLKRATKIKGLGFNSFHDEALKVKGRIGEYYKPYTLKEREQIDSAIKSDIAHIKSLLHQYKSTGLGPCTLR
eukprot:NODE_2015_length_1158_cov_49.640155_g1998_i0.p1 GENE.NODE_2015_length_1158_cov_49.640155_g1998_i0~~NODE_2015_length_1158_cov_49.640155_g1998_i0.p1  ORF type:complete len:360 (-),score=-88.62 NODE_2015_length_1158_cov_49.640155_g1998_i0:4-1083(-)